MFTVSNRWTYTELILICLLDHLFLDATFSFNFQFLLLMCFFPLYSTAWALSLLLNVNENEMNENVAANGSTDL